MPSTKEPEQLKNPTWKRHVDGLMRGFASRVALLVISKPCRFLAPSVKFLAVGLHRRPLCTTIVCYQVDRLVYASSP